ncbi:uncharacterized protein LOC127284058 [Leptopilina boulardi]|uniref:uncharacterized protein LOC127284058 n=1 Tax=Leptopilina boulardi TaxID=63433 RepID=UPI0021F5998C|nr:uncharacterized protein LOC127284058 [Leptopilina boulardi]
MNLSQALPNIDKKYIDREMLKLTLSLYNNPHLSRKGVDEVVDTFNKFTSKMFIPFIQKEMETHVTPISTEMAYSKSQFILENSKDVFKKFSTEHLRFNMYEEKSSYIRPQLFEIGKEPTYITKDDKSVIVEMKSIFAAYVPLKDTLQTVLSKPGILDSIIQYMDDLGADKKYLRNVIQGDLWLKKYHDPGKIIIPLHFYFDEFETRNPLGSHAGEEKLGDLHLLSTQGITLNLNGLNRTIFFQLIQVLGDNLGQNMICGFTDSFKFIRFCRICTATNTQCFEMIEEDESLLRDVKSYEKNIVEKNFSDSGLKEKCVFNEINKFDIGENKSLDFMHDVPEGVGVYTMSKIIEGLISTKEISLEVINNRIESFPLNEVEKSNRPRPIFYSVGKKGGQKIKIRQSASEMMCLIRYFGLMVGNLVFEKNTYWKLYLVLRKMVGIMTSPTLDRGQIQNLTELIKQHNKQYLRLFGKLKPKMHFLLHYPGIMLLLGPVVHFSAMKFERKNKELKEFATATTSNINLPLSIAIRHQLNLCYKTELCPHIEKDIILGTIHNTNAHTDLKNLIPTLPDGVPTYTLKEIEIFGKKISKGTVIVSRISEDGPTFGKVKNIFHCKNVYIEIEEFETLYFNHHFYAYCVQSIMNSPILLINVDLIPRITPCLFVEKLEDEFIATRFEI